MIDISCIISTYGRWWCLEEAIESCRRQAGDVSWECIVVNDMPDQTLHCDDDRVRILNLPERLPNPNDKWDIGAAEARGKYMCQLGDDDVALSHRFAQSLERMESRDLTYYKNPVCFFWNMGKITDICGNRMFGAAMYRRDLYMSAGGCGGDGWDDVNAETRMMDIADPATVLIEDDAETAYYVYRWGGITAHWSAHSTDPIEAARIFDLVVRGSPHFRAGDIELNPRFRWDYETLCMLALRRLAQATGKTGGYVL